MKNIKKAMIQAFFLFLELSLWINGRIIDAMFSTYEKHKEEIDEIISDGTKDEFN